MIIVCAWCKMYLGEKAPYDDVRQTHSICPECKKQALREAEEYVRLKETVATFN